MNRHLMGKKITGILIILWMIVIFAFSAQPAQQSSQTSGTVAYQITKWQNSLFHQGKTGEELYALANSMQFAIRKSAHMGEYAILAFLLCLHMSYYRFSPKKSSKHNAASLPSTKRPLDTKRLIFLSLTITAGYAATDEFHQLFVPGRACRVMDVCIDSLGGAFGIIFFLILYKYFPLCKHRILKKRNQQKGKHR